MTAGIKQTPEMSMALLRQGLDAAFDRVLDQLGALAAGSPAKPFAPPEGSALVTLGRIFGLGAAEQGLIALAAGQELSPRIGAALGKLTPAETIDTEFCARLLGPQAWDMLCPDAPLRHWRLIEAMGNGPLRRRAIRIDERIVHFLLGTTYIDARLGGLLRRVTRAGGAGDQGAVRDLAQTIAGAWAGAAQPPVIVLDEPTAGVDVELRQGLWQFVRRLNGEGHTIILTTHYLEEAEALCGRIALMKQGRVVALDTTANLMAAHPGGTLEDVFVRAMHQ